MIVYKSWKKYDQNFQVTYIWYGWFLFGVLPLYLVRVKLER